ncbi:hypothetical protein CRG98_016044 [Punica granatum]|uniref:Uncharacterized protein n=1 Tax=Punica granatum TaxID=22663 RepID=A0A2I0K4V1_PUNGR|nr:hypothetical protein CRG98_016044 [Punica granatum]
MTVLVCDRELDEPESSKCEVSKPETSKYGAGAQKWGRSRMKGLSSMQGLSPMQCVGSRGGMCVRSHGDTLCRAGWVAGMDSASGHSTSRYGEVKTAGGLPAKVGTTRQSCGVGGRDGLGFWS